MANFVFARKFEGYTRFVVDVDDFQGIVNVTAIAGRAPYTDEVYSAVMETVLNADGFVEAYPRRNCFRLVRKVGYSGCTDYYLEENRDGNVVRHKILHESMYGKVNEDVKNVFLDDLLVLMEAQGWLSRTLDRSAFGADENAYTKFVMLQKYTAREPDKEMGWQRPDGTMCRDLEVQDTISDIHSAVGGEPVPSIAEGVIGSIWRDTEKAYEEFCAEEKEVI